jgi:hypothetical protein
MMAMPGPTAGSANTTCCVASSMRTDSLRRAGSAGADGSAAGGAPWSQRMTMPFALLPPLPIGPTLLPAAAHLNAPSWHASSK